MPAGYGNDNDNDGNRRDKDVQSNDFTTTYLTNFIFLKKEPRAEG